MAEEQAVLETPEQVNDTDASEAFDGAVSEHDAELNDLLRDAGNEIPEPTLERKRGPDGRFVSTETNEETEASQEAATEAPEESDADDSSEGSTDTALPEGVTPEDVHKARTALVYKGKSSDELDKWFERDPEGFIQAGLLVHSAQADSSREFQKQRDEMESLRKQAEAKQSVEEAAKPSDTSFELNGQVDPLVEYLAEQFGDEAADPVRKTFQAVTDSVVNGLHEQYGTILKQQHDQLQLLRGVTERMLFENQRASLKDEYPEITDVARAKSVFEQSEKIAGQRQFSDMDDYFSQLPDIVKEAARIEFTPELLKKAEAAEKKVKDANKKLQDARDNGSVAVKERAGEGKKPETRDEKFNRALKLRMEGKDADAEVLEKEAARMLS